jgi:hypothetical protein
MPEKTYCSGCLPKAIRAKADVIEIVQEMITDWESGIDPDDKTLYSLGLRRVLDILEEHLEG